MSSQRKTEANRRNAQASTGPQTAQGKAASSQNARRHGLSSATVFIPPDRQEEFEAAYTAYFDEIKPIGEIQMTYFEQLIHAVWNLNLARQLLVAALHHLDDRKIANANRYVAQYERAFAKAHQAIQAEQTSLALRALPENEPIADLPIACQAEVIGRAATRLAASQERTQRPAYRAFLLTAVGQAFRPPVPLMPAAA